MADCIFCKIAGGGMGTEFLYEDDAVVVFRDINPKAKTHLLVVPRKHIESVASLEEVDAELMGHLVMCAKRVADELGLSGYKLLINVGKDGGQEIFHVHAHLMADI